MRNPSNILLIAVSLLFLSTACSSGEEGYQRPKVWPKPTEPPPASPIYHDVDDWIPGEQDIAREAREHNALLTREVERALGGADLVRRETVFAHIVPELLQVEPKRLVDLHATLAPGKPRQMLCTEIAAQWTNSDPGAARSWMKSLAGEERRTAAVAAIASVAFWDPRMAVVLADEFEVRQDAKVRKLLASIDKAGRGAVVN